MHVADDAARSRGRRLDLSAVTVVVVVVWFSACAEHLTKPLNVALPRQ